MKTCRTCKIEKSLENYYKAKNHKDGFRNNCKACNAEVRRKRLKKPEVAIYMKEYRKNYHLRDSVKQATKEYYSQPHVRQRLKEKGKIYYQNHGKIDPRYRLAKNLRKRVWRALKQKSKVGSAIKDLGCSILELRIYLESKFQSGMTWENYGPYGWHIDHKIPLSKFDLTDRTEFLKACNYTNLQPLWAADNLSKGDRIVET